MSRRHYKTMVGFGEDNLSDQLTDGGLLELGSLTDLLQLLFAELQVDRRHALTPPDCRLDAARWYRAAGSGRGLFVRVAWAEEAFVEDQGALGVIGRVDDVGLPEADGIASPPPFEQAFVPHSRLQNPAELGTGSSVIGKAVDTRGAVVEDTVDRNILRIAHLVSAPPGFPLSLHQGGAARRPAEYQSPACDHNAFDKDTVGHATQPALAG
ncbi:hypothetical protein [Nocardiopsis gilva]|uniref:hypothetical protein n=1 Tax=Nocardiopsis gilva TaxID=280236 RepID=UPI0012FD5BE5|nr:hypothetical protein [Nocardiopsis gilva]